MDARAFDLNSELQKRNFNKHLGLHGDVQLACLKDGARKYDISGQGLLGYVSTPSSDTSIMPLAERGYLSTPSSDTSIMSLAEWMARMPVKYLALRAAQPWPQGKVCVVFCDIDGRRTSVACAEAFSRLLSTLDLDWVHQEPVLHASCQSWLWATCQNCEECRQQQTQGHKEVDQLLSEAGVALQGMCTLDGIKIGEVSYV